MDPNGEIQTSKVSDFPSDLGSPTTEDHAIPACGYETSVQKGQQASGRRCQRSPGVRNPCLDHLNSQMMRTWSACFKTSSAKLLPVFDPPFRWSCIPRQALLGGHAPPSIVQLRWRFKSFLHWLTFGEGQTSDLGECWALRQAFLVPIRQRNCATTLRDWIFLNRFQQCLVRVQFITTYYWKVYIYILNIKKIRYICITQFYIPILQWME